MAAKPNLPQFAVPVEATFVYSQDADSCQSGGCGQTLRVHVEDAGGGCFLVLSTERWALDVGDLPAFMAMLKAAVTGHTGIRSLFDEVNAMAGADSKPAK